MLTLTFLIYMILFFVYCSGDPRDLHSFPTRRSSDLEPCRRRAVRAPRSPAESLARGMRGPGSNGPFCTDAASRSEEHTSELQSLTNLVCRLLLEKKK